MHRDEARPPCRRWNGCRTFQTRCWCSFDRGSGKKPKSLSGCGWRRRSKKWSLPRSAEPILKATWNCGICRRAWGSPEQYGNSKGIPPSNSPNPTGFISTRPNPTIPTIPMALSGGCMATAQLRGIPSGARPPRLG